MTVIVQIIKQNSTFRLLLQPLRTLRFGFAHIIMCLFLMCACVSTRLFLATIHLHAAARSWHASYIFTMKFTSWPTKKCINSAHLITMTMRRSVPFSSRKRKRSHHVQECLRFHESHLQTVLCFHTLRYFSFYSIIWHLYFVRDGLHFFNCWIWGSWKWDGK